MPSGPHKLLTLLADGEFHSGERLADSLELTRAAVWKTIRQLQHLGLEIESRHGRGYRLQPPLELLDRECILDKLSGAGKQACHDIEILFQTDSTNRYLLERIRHEACNGLVVLAEYQSQGKGRRGNDWRSPLASGIYLSLAWHSDSSVDSFGLMSLFIGIAVVRMLSHFGIQGLGLKWPNDILINHEKVGGVLLEMQGEATGPVDMVIGVGLNNRLNETLKISIDQPATDIQQHLATPVSRNTLTARLISNLFEVLLCSKQQRETLLEEWRTYDCYREKQARLLLPDVIIEGQLQGVDEQGCLLMNVNGELQRFMSGEISLRVSS